MFKISIATGPIFFLSLLGKASVSVEWQEFGEDENSLDKSLFYSNPQRTLPLLKQPGCCR